MEGAKAVPERLSVEPAGLQAAAAALADQEKSLRTPRTAGQTHGKPSGAGAASFTAGVDAFAAAYADRLQAHSTSVAAMAVEYMARDENSGNDISSVRL